MDESAHVVANWRYLTRQPEQAEDLAQEVFVKADVVLALGLSFGRRSA